MLFQFFGADQAQHQCLDVEAVEPGAALHLAVRPARCAGSSARTSSRPTASSRPATSSTSAPASCPRSSARRCRSFDAAVHLPRRLAGQPRLGGVRRAELRHHRPARGLASRCATTTTSARTRPRRRSEFILPDAAARSPTPCASRARCASTPGTSCSRRSRCATSRPTTDAPYVELQPRLPQRRLQPDRRRRAPALPASTTCSTRRRRTRSKPASRREFMDRRLSTSAERLLHRGEGLVLLRLRSEHEHAEPRQPRQGRLQGPRGRAAGSRDRQPRRLPARVGYTDSEIKEEHRTRDAPSDVGNQAPLVSKYTVNLGAQYRHALGGFGDCELLHPPGLRDHRRHLVLPRQLHRARPGQPAEPARRARERVAGR